MRTYNTQYNIGKSKYVVNFHDGDKTHGDGSKFYEIRTFKNKKNFEEFKTNLERNGYKYK